MKIKQVSSLEKVMPKMNFEAKTHDKLTVLTGEEGAYQVAFRSKCCAKVNVNVKSDIDEHVKVFWVDCVPVMFPIWNSEVEDDYYVSKEPGMFPDVLRPVGKEPIRATGYWQSLWITVERTAPVGVHSIIVELTEDEETQSCTMEYEVIPVQLPEQKLLYTQWFYADCIADFYKVEVWSEEHWHLIESFLAMAAKYGINMLLTPIFTPPLDTAVGGERTTNQLVKITKDGEKYAFDFSLLKRWVDMAKSYGIKYFEMAHLFTQWGAKFTPKIMAWENGEEKRIFGWDVSATDERYDCFLSQFLPALTEFLREEGIAENTYFHISDEPTSEMLEDYQKSKSIAEKYLDGFKIIDALSDYEFYKQGVIKRPIPITGTIHDFIGNVDELWGYYCGQIDGCSNRQMALQSVRNRFLGVQLHKYNVYGFLHWGYNFYNTAYSYRSLNPFLETDAGGYFTAGGSYSVYPGENGALASFRLIVFHEGLQDLAALQLLESFIGHEKTVEFVESYTGNIIFKECAFDPDVLLDMRRALNEKLRELAK